MPPFPAAVPPAPLSRTPPRLRAALPAAGLSSVPSVSTSHTWRLATASFAFRNPSAASLAAHSPFDAPILDHTPDNTS